MAKKIAKLLKTDVMADIDMPGIAQFLQSQGRRGDSILAHINPKEAMLLQNMGGAGTSNPATGLPEFYIDESGFDSSYGFNRGYDKVYEYDPVNEVAAGNMDQINQNALDLEAAQRYSDIAASGYRETDRKKNIFSGGTAGGADRFGTSPITTNRFNVPNVAKGFDEFGFPIISGADGLPFESDRSALQLDRFTVPNVAKGFNEAGFPTLPGAEGQPEPEQQLPPDNRNAFRRGVDYLKETTDLSGRDLARLGLAAGLGIQGALGSREAAEQGRKARAEQEEIARPYRERGAELLAQAEGGQLTPQGQQSLQAMRARLAQGVEARGGVGAQQAQAQIENYRQQLIANQYDYGMKISNVGDQLMLGAIRTGLEADRYATQMTNNYYTNMARILVGMGTDENELKQITQSGNGGK